MSLRLASTSSFAAAFISLLAGACSPANIATSGTGGTGGTGGSASTGSIGGTMSTGGGNACTMAGGTCQGLAPTNCANGTWGDASKYSCGGGAGVGCCLPAPACPSPCTLAGDVRCAGNAMETCTIVPDDSLCGLMWRITAACPSGEVCNTDATKCIAPPSTCTTSADCGCGCGCGGGMCHCTGSVPPTCNAASDCGPACAGYICVSHQCELQVCTPGMDQTCNSNPGMSAFAGTCFADSTCTCKPGFTKKPDGRCG